MPLNPGFSQATSVSSGTVVVSSITGSIAAHILSTNGTMAVNIGKTDGTITVRIDPGYELGSIKGINTSINAFIGGTAGTLGIRFTDEPTVIASGKQGTITRPFITNTDGALKVYDVVNGTIGVSGITNSIAVHVLSTGGTINVNLKPGTIAVSLDPGKTLGAISGINTSVAVYFDRGNPSVDTELPTATAFADNTAPPTAPATYSSPLLVNGIGNLEKAKTVTTTFDSSSVGIPAQGMVGQLDDAGTQTVTEDNFGVIRISSRRAQLVEGVASGTAIPISGTLTGISGTVNIAADIVSGGTDPASEGPVKVGGKYNSTAPILLTGQRGDVQLDSSGNVFTTLATSLAGEDLVNSLLKVEQRFTHITIFGSGTTVVKTTAGLLHKLIVNGGVAGTVVVYNNTASASTGSATRMYDFDPMNAPAVFEFNNTFSGLVVGTSSAIRLTFIYR